MLPRPCEVTVDIKLHVHAIWSSSSFYSQHNQLYRPIVTLMLYMQYSMVMLYTSPPPLFRQAKHVYVTATAAASRVNGKQYQVTLSRLRFILNREPTGYQPILAVPLTGWWTRRHTPTRVDGHWQGGRVLSMEMKHFRRTRQLLSCCTANRLATEAISSCIYA